MMQQRLVQVAKVSKLIMNEGQCCVSMFAFLSYGLAICYMLRTKSCSQVLCSIKNSLKITLAFTQSLLNKSQPSYTL